MSRQEKRSPPQAVREGDAARERAKGARGIDEGRGAFLLLNFLAQLSYTTLDN